MPLRVGGELPTIARAIQAPFAELLAVREVAPRAERPATQLGPRAAGSVRPGIVVSNSIQNERLDSVVIVPLSTRSPELWPTACRGSRHEDVVRGDPGNPTGPDRHASGDAMVRIGAALALYLDEPRAAGPSPAPDASGTAMLRRSFSLVFWLFLAASSIVLSPVAVLIWAVTAPFDRRGALLHRFTCFWASLYTWLNPAWRVRVEGRERIRPDAAYVMVANHQSLLDILVLFRLFVHFKWVSKIENFRVPFIGWNMALNRYIKLRRGSRESVARALHACERALAQGSSIMMFPEGTRSPDRRLRAFKPGAFTLAQRTGAPILPIVIEGTASALPNRGFVLQGRHAIRVRVLDEIPHASFAREPVEAVTEAVRERFVAALDEREQGG